MTDDVADAIEEQFAGAPTGVELETDDAVEDGLFTEPWDPDKIRVSTKNFSLRHVLDMIDGDDLELAPDFQRNRVWKARQKSRLLESLLLQIPLPAFYFAEDEDGRLRVVDGLQRLSTIHGFVRLGEFTLKELEYLHQEEGHSFPELPPVLQRRLLNTQIVVHVIDPTTPPAVMYDIFRRINTGGEPLNSMEIRHSMSSPRSRAFLKMCANSDRFNQATGGALYHHVRMHDREAVLRFVAFSLLDSIWNYEQFGSLERLLAWANGRLDDNTDLDDDALDSLRVRFEASMEKAFLIFGRHAFRRWPYGTERLFPINRALFESWGVALTAYSIEQVAASAESIALAAREAMTSDGEYIASISSSTGDPRRVLLRFETATSILREILE